MSVRSLTVSCADGTVWDLVDGPVRARMDQVVFGSAPSRVSLRERINLAGASAIGVRHGVRDLVVPVVFLGDTVAGLDDLLRRFIRSTDPDSFGRVTIRTSNNVDGVEREIDAFLVEGLDSIGYERADALEAETVLLFQANDPPYWRDTVPVVIEVDPPLTVWESGAATGYDEPYGYDDLLPYEGAQFGEIGYDDPLNYDDPVPYDGAAASVVILELSNPGDVWAWPRFEVVGAASRVSAANLSTGESWRLSSGLVEGERLVVSTTPGAASVRFNDVLGLGRFDDGADLWGLPPGFSVLVALEIEDRGSGASFSVSWVPEWLRP